MDRRAFIGAVAGGLLAAPLAAGAQPARVARIGYLSLVFAGGCRQCGGVSAGWRAWLSQPS
jgi:hypothetical protein